MSDLENIISQSINDAMPIYKELKEREKREKNRPDPGLYTMGNELIKSWKELVEEDYIKLSYRALFPGTNREKLVGKLVISNEIICINEKTFEGCTHLEDILLPINIESIEVTAFDGCTSLYKYHTLNDFKELVQVLCDNAEVMGKVQIVQHVKPDRISGLYNMNNTRTYDWDELIKSNSILIDGNVLYQGPERKSMNYKLVIEEGVTVIDQNAFEGCTRLKYIDLPNSVTEILCGAFDNCSCLQLLKIPDFVTQIAFKVFKDCTSLEYVHIPNSVTKIGGYAFWDCVKLPNIVIPNSVVEIGQNAFDGCTRLREVRMSDSIREIGHEAFKDCINLGSITLPANIENIGYDIFAGCTKLFEKYGVSSSEELVKILMNDSKESNAEKMNLF